MYLAAKCGCTVGLASVLLYRFFTRSVNNLEKVSTYGKNEFTEIM